MDILTNFVHMNNILEELYENLTGSKPDSIVTLTKAGSNRQYFRLEGRRSLVGVVGTSIEENESFIYLSRHFSSLELPVPSVLAVSADSSCYLQEDLGNVSLFDMRSDWDLVEKAVSVLPSFQYKGARGLDFSRCYPVSDFDSQSILWDLNYFKYCFLNTSGVSYRENLLEEDFRKMAQRLSENSGDTFMYRDFQSRNVMIRDGKPYFIDFQGGRRGPAIYDLVSFVNQARAAFPHALKKRLIEAYIHEASVFTTIDVSEFHEKFREFSLLRNLQVLGAYGFRGRFERKPHFMASIPPALKSLAALLESDFNKYPYLTDILKNMIAKETVANVEQSTTAAESKLTVTVSSFSYKKGIPEDPSGNGGGFVFDCRGMENPGRYDEYKQITGLDKPVIDFLESKGEIKPFLEHCYAVVDPSVDCYDRRGFSSLMVSFGCTGGQHRSVYSAEHMAAHLKSKFPRVNVRLVHREQNIDRIL